MEGGSNAEPGELDEMSMGAGSSLKSQRVTPILVSLLQQGESWMLGPPFLSCTFDFALGRPAEKMAEGSERASLTLGLEPSCRCLWADTMGVCREWE